MNPAFRGIIFLKPLNNTVKGFRPAFADLLAEQCSLAGESGYAQAGLKLLNPALGGNRSTMEAIFQRAKVITGFMLRLRFKLNQTLKNLTEGVSNGREI